MKNVSKRLFIQEDREVVNKVVRTEILSSFSWHHLVDTDNNKGKKKTNPIALCCMYRVLCYEKRYVCACVCVYKVVVELN